MAIQSGFFNAQVDEQGNYDRAGTAEQFAKYFSQLIGNGVFPNPSTNFQVLASSGMTLTVKSGYAWINGYWAWLDVDDTVTIDSSSMSLPRIDRVVLRLDLTQSGRVISLAVKTGTESSTPVAPTLTRNNEVYEIALADISVAVNASSITQSNITDTRLNTDLCGIVTSLVDQVDTTTLYNQIQSDLSEFKSVSQADFEAWVATIHGILDSETAGHLLELIEGITAKIPTGYTTVSPVNNVVTLSKQVTPAGCFYVEQDDDFTYQLNFTGGTPFISLAIKMTAEGTAATFDGVDGASDLADALDTDLNALNIINFVKVGTIVKGYVL